MSKRELPDGYRVRYRHVRVKADPTGLPDPRGGGTVALIYRDGSDLCEAHGYARCHSKDNYSKRIGRDVALGRALKNLEERADGR